VANGVPACALTRVENKPTRTFNWPSQSEIARRNQEAGQDCITDDFSSLASKRGTPMTFRPLHDRVLVRRVEAAEKTAGGIIIPDTAQEKPQEGEVVAVGTGVRSEDGAITPLDVKAGDRILFGKWSGAEVSLDGEDLLIMKESDVLGIVG
jgi:chaperonin GroES